MSQSGVLALSPPTQQPPPPPLSSSIYASSNSSSVAQHGGGSHHHHHGHNPSSHCLTPPTQHGGNMGGNSVADNPSELSGGATHSHSEANSSTPLPRLIISEANSHCVQAFDRLRVQREQSRFTDLILSVQGREFPAHRCVLAACR